MCRRVHLSMPKNHSNLINIPTEQGVFIAAKAGPLPAGNTKIVWT